MLPHAKVIVRAPDGDLGTDAVIKGARKAAAAPLEIGKDAIASLGAQHVEALCEKAFVVHHRHARPILASRWGSYSDLLSVLRPCDE